VRYFAQFKHPENWGAGSLKDLPFAQEEHTFKQTSYEKEAPSNQVPVDILDGENSELKRKASSTSKESDTCESGKDVLSL